MVFAVFGVSELVDEVLDRLGGRPDEDETPEVAHLLALLVLEATIVHPPLTGVRLNAFAEVMLGICTQ